MTREDDIAVVGSPSTNTELTLDILLEATEERLVGALANFRCSQNGEEVISIGQITEIELRNRWHEDSVFRNLIKRSGEIPPITNRQDTRTASFSVGATFRSTSDGYEPEILGMVPPTGSTVSRVSQELLSTVLSAFESEIFYLGRAYANDILYPMWFKHFGRGVGGAGEAYHIGIFGKTGSGKSGLAKYLLLAYARHSQMGVLILDPQGEFSREVQGVRVGEQGLAVDGSLAALGRRVERYAIGDLQLDEWDMLEELLAVLGTLDAFGIRHPANRAIAADLIVTDLQKAKLKLADLDSVQAFVQVLQIAKANAPKIYTSAPAQRIVDRTDELLADPEAGYRQHWQRLASMFAQRPGRRTLYGIAAGLLPDQTSQPRERPIIVVDLSERGNQGIWSDELERRIISRLLSLLVVRASQALDSSDTANLLILLDEAHRHAPSGSVEANSQAAALRNVLRRAIRETRKYGVGWFLISQTIGGLDPEVLQQLRMMFFGFGLAMGDEFRKLGEFAGGDRRSLDLYQSFRDPHSAPRPDLREFPWMAVGPVSPLAFSGRPIFFSAFSNPDQFLSANGLPTQLL